MHHNTLAHPSQSQALPSGSNSHHPISRNHNLPVGNGVLSSLLHLYNHPISAQSSSATLLTFGSEDDSESGSRTGSISLRNSLEKSSKRISRSWARVTENLLNERPAAARSSGGVIGALQAGAMGLAGAAAPTASRVAPVTNKPGFRVGRYSPASELPTAEPRLSSDQPYESPEPDPRLRRTSVPDPNGSEDEKLGLRRIASEVTTTLSPPDTASRPHFGRSASSIFGVTTPGLGPRSQISKSGSLVNLRALGEVLNPQTYHTESAVLRAKRVGGTLSSGSTPGTPRDELGVLHPTHSHEKEKEKSSRGQNAARRRREKRRQEEIFITMHVAAILQRQEFILQLTRAMMMFGGPSHRLESQIQATARVLEIDLQMVLIYSSVSQHFLLIASFTLVIF